MSADPLDCALDLMRRLPPHKVEDNLSALIEIVPDLTDDLLSAVDQPLQVRTCKQSGREYLICDYNRDGDSYRSPWSNEYEPPVSSGGDDEEEPAYPSDRLRRLEVAANDAFDTYRDLYYEGGCSSVYMWDLDTGFAAVVLIQKKVNNNSGAGGGGKNQQKGSWDSIHVLEINENSNRTSAHYKLTSTVMLYTMTSNPGSSGTVDLTGSMTRQLEQDHPLTSTNSSSNSASTSAPLAGSGNSGEADGSHIENIGKMIEDMEFKMRHSLQDIYFGKTRDILNDLRSFQPLSDKSKQNEMQKELAAKLRGSQLQQQQQQQQK